MKNVRFIGAVAAGVAMAGAGWASAQVFDKVPDNATAVLEIRNLDDLNTKISHAADTYGLTAQVPQLKDPLGSFEDSAGISDKGINKAGDLALAFFAPPPGSPAGPGSQPQVLALVPVSDYKQFLANFTEAKDDGAGITECKDKSNETIFIVKWGDYAAISQAKDLVSKAPAGLKLTGVAADELKKDTLLYINMDQVRTLALPQLKDHRDDILKQMTDSQQMLPDNMKAIAKTADSALLDQAQEFLQDTKFAVMSANLTDDGIATAGAAEFVPDSKFGKLAATVKGTDQPMLAGLPDRKYLYLIGLTPSKEFSQAFDDVVVQPFIKSIDAQGGDTKSVDKIAQIWHDEWQSVQSIAGGAAVPGQLGKDGLLEMVQVFTGDANAFKKAYSDGILAGNDFMKSFTPGGATTPAMSMSLKPDAATVDGVHFDLFSVKMDGGNGAQGMQMQMMMNMMYGANGPGGYIGVVNDKTTLQVTGVDDQSALMADAVASAKGGKDVVSDGKPLQTTAALLPKQRVLESYVFIDQLINTGVQVAQNFGAPIKFKVPADVPPIGVTLSGDGSATVRVDAVYPSALIQAVVGVVNDANAMRNGPPGGGGQGGGGGL